jgi:hypothetical protein
MELVLTEGDRATRYPANGRPMDHAPGGRLPGPGLRHRVVDRHDARTSLSERRQVLTATCCALALERSRRCVADLLLQRRRHFAKGQGRNSMAAGFGGVDASFGRVQARPRLPDVTDPAVNRDADRPAGSLHTIGQRWRRPPPRRRVHSTPRPPRRFSQLTAPRALAHPAGAGIAATTGSQVAAPHTQTARLSGVPDLR